MTSPAFDSASLSPAERPAASVASAASRSVVFPGRFRSRVHPETVSGSADAKMTYLRTHENTIKI